MLYKALLGVVASQFHPRLKQFSFIDYEWIVKCLQENRLQSLESYAIKWTKAEPEKEAPPEKIRDIYATRHQLKGGPAQNRRLKRNQKDTEALDQYLEEENLEMEALLLESRLLLGSLKKVRTNNYIVGPTKYLFDFSWHEVNEDQEMGSPRTELISMEEEEPVSVDDWKMEGYSNENSNFSFLKVESEDMWLKTTKENTRSFSQEVLIIDDSEENTFNEILRNSDPDVELVDVIAATKDEDSKGEFY